MCITTTPLVTALLPSIALKLSSDINLLKLIFAYQKNPNNLNSNKIKLFLKKSSNQSVETIKMIYDSKFNVISTIMDYEGNLLWTSTDNNIRLYKIITK